VAYFPPLVLAHRPGAIPWKGELYMRDYELTIIAHPDLEETALNDIVDRIQGWVTAAGGIIVKVDVWGKRQLAYPIRKQKDGLYVFFQLKIPPTFGIELERNLRFLEPVMRFLIIAVEVEIEA
jgi:small subunit ribosomal protein S6